MNKLVKSPFIFLNFKKMGKKDVGIGSKSFVKETFMSKKAAELLDKFMNIPNLDYDDKIRLLACAMSIAKKLDLKAGGITVKYGVKMPILLKEKNGMISGLSFFDHGSVMTRKESIKKVESIEPYSISLENIKELVSFCEKEKLDCSLSGNSIYFPGRTVHISFEKK